MYNPKKEKRREREASTKVRLGRTGAVVCWRSLERFVRLELRDETKGRFRSLAWVDLLPVKFHRLFFLLFNFHHQPRKIFQALLASLPTIFIICVERPVFTLPPSQLFDDLVSFMNWSLSALSLFLALRAAVRGGKKGKQSPLASLIGSANICRYSFVLLPFVPSR